MNINKKYENKICKDCLIDLTPENTNKYSFDRSKYVCKLCEKKRAQRKYIERKELIREQQRIYDLSCKQKVIEAYGGKCACCGESIIEFLTIDHINNNGAEDRKNNGNKTGGKLYRWLIKNNFPQGEYQVLCFNCNCSKGFFGYCPHNKLKIVVRVTRKTIKKKSNFSRS
jgi:hypothetical protein